MKLLIALLLFLFLSCKPADLNNSGDPFSNSYVSQNLVLCALGKGFCDPCVGVSNYISFMESIGSGIMVGLRSVLDSSQNSYVIGQTNQLVAGADGITSFQGTVGNSQNLILSKKNKQGGKEWIKYLGRKSDRPIGILHTKNGGIYFFASTPTSLPGPKRSFVGTPDSSSNIILGKMNPNGNLEWFTYLNNGTTATSDLHLVDMIDTEDQSGILLFGNADTALANPGTILTAAPSNNDWFLMKISYSGDPISIRYYEVPTPLSSFRPRKFVSIPNNGGYYLQASVLNTFSLYPNGLNTYTGSFNNALIVKLASNLNYEWHRYFGTSSGAPEDTPFFPMVALSDSSLVFANNFNVNIITLGLGHPETTPTNYASLFYSVNASGALLYSSFTFGLGDIAKTYELVKKNDNELIAFNGSGGGAAENASIVKISATNFTKLASQPRPGVFLTSGCLVCGKIFATAYSPINVDGAIIPFGAGSGVGGVFNSYHSVFSPSF
ncbi:hypothetical protein EHQ68_18665 [Leptospira congkakensis]|uniref:Lipoprotein n=1 Tax=Leptospira congkakensis TaxID=2484932 RepID=A0A4Z1A3R1_9LEPT|nr:hypothetical protein [Leptospira congkakensis]TGL84869.1 hypothetical protein EHQ68_18665 [Leptospira congkakensis]TGL92112.1 hypothetical protein EHQ69_09070 [Leptospira congkakensis]TGL96671.1 hypothetical protein EHQ70_09065 [Leptospira congkakensis]